MNARTNRSTISAPATIEPLLSPREASLALGVSVSTLYGLIRRGALKAPIHLSPKLSRFPQSEIVAYIQLRTQARDQGHITARQGPVG